LTVFSSRRVYRALRRPPLSIVRICRKLLTVALETVGDDAIEHTAGIRLADQRDFVDLATKPITAHLMTSDRRIDKLVRREGFAIRHVRNVNVVRRRYTQIHR